MTNEFIAELDDNSLLQADATIIAGLLILLTIYSLRIKPSENTRERRINKLVGWVIVFGIVPFSASAWIILNHLSYAAIMTSIGFLYLLPLSGLYQS